MLGPCCSPCSGRSRVGVKQNRSDTRLPFRSQICNDSFSRETLSERSMSKTRIGRIIAAVISGYVTNGILVVATEQLLSLLTGAAGQVKPAYYLVIDLVSQCLYTVGAGYLCCVIARPLSRIALVGLIGLGLSVGSVSLVTSWKGEPHWYGIGLLAVYAPCGWIGWTWRARQAIRSTARGTS